MTPTLSIPEPAKGNCWHSQSAEKVLAQLGASATGSSVPEATNRLFGNGPNELKEGKRPLDFQLHHGCAEANSAGCRDRGGETCRTSSGGASLTILP